MLRLERHRLGPRVYLCGLRIHEFALGFGVFAILLAGGAAELWGLTPRTEAAALFGAWLVGKDWRDLFPSKRNTASWSLLPHRVPRDQALTGASAPEWPPSRGSVGRDDGIEAPLAGDAFEFVGATVLESEA